MAEMRQSRATHGDRERQHGDQARRAVVLVGHGGVHAEIDIPETIDALRAEFPHLSVRYAWPFGGEHLAGFFVEHLRRIESRERYV